MKRIMKLKYLISLSAFIIAGCAAYFSVTGIGALFAGATISAMVMAGVLEAGKLISVSFLYRNWKGVPFLLKIYMLIASIVLVIITSVGIYGFLTSAYQTTIDKINIMDRQVEVIELRKTRLSEQLNLYIVERERVSENVSELNRGLAGNIVQYRDPESGQIISTTSAANRTALQQQLGIAVEERSNLGIQIETLSDSITSLDLQILEISANNEIAGEIGPLRYLSNLTGWSMDKVVNAFTLLIVFVFDPLAISLVLAYNYLVKREEEIVVSAPITPTSKKKIKPFSVFGDSPTEATAEELPDDLDQFYRSLRSSEEGDSDDIAPDIQSLDEHLITKQDIVEESLEQVDESEIDKYDILCEFMNLNEKGVPEWMDPNFDWDHDVKWMSNPLAKIYKKEIVDKDR